MPDNQLSPQLNPQVIKPRKIPNLIGYRQGKLVVLKYLKHRRFTKKVESVWLCQCDCGKQIELIRSSLYPYKTQSCGCLTKEIRRKIFGNQKGINNRAWKHGKSHDRQFQRIKHINRKFGLSESSYLTLLKNQNNQCAICHKNASNFKHSLSVDHDHNTGKIRGLLCSACNIGLGMFHDSLENLKGAIQYLYGINS